MRGGRPRPSRLSATTSFVMATSLHHFRGDNRQFYWISSDSSSRAGFGAGLVARELGGDTHGRRLSPERTNPVDVLDTVLNATLFSEVGDGAPTPLHRPKIIDDHETPVREFVVQIRQAIEGRFIHVAVEPQNGQGLNLGLGQGL